MITNFNATKDRENVFIKIFKFYRDGFKAMTVGKTLWVIIFIKLFVFFVILRFIFFPNFLNSKAETDQEKANYVKEQLTKRR